MKLLFHFYYFYHNFIFKKKKQITFTTGQWIDICFNCLIYVSPQYEEDQMEFTPVSLASPKTSEEQHVSCVSCTGWPTN